ncbi:cystinosin-like isoform X2 [Mercenaria mercenaria]|uniref:cystinosin-like isoform X2 n=1 Tax=Mercenaria mercenaria TaxID=6596 RepID=UPI001E1D4037|nr:cystinosin-like isoform X2 [Mercenaria mercenaria]
MSFKHFIVAVLYFKTALCVELQFLENDIQIVVDRTSSIKLTSNLPVVNETTLRFTYQIGNGKAEDTQGSDNYVDPLLDLHLEANKKVDKNVNITGNNPGHLIIGLESNSTELKDLEDVFVRVDLVNSKILVTINAIIGWVYFAAWSISFYPQVYENFRRKSVIGLNFDFLLYNITGFLAYGFFNVGMFWVSSVKSEYHSNHPRGINPVQLNDVIFTLHAIFVTIITIIQCFIYERGEQKVSKICLVLVIGAWLFAGISLVVTLFHKISWLTYLYYFSYIKLGVTLIKYMPQAWMNFKRKSTEGWSIGNVLLDFTGGSLSLLQMFLLSYNSDDWGSIFGDPTKFGLGFFSILFDILFITQHYCLYWDNAKYGSLVDHEYEEKEVLVNDSPHKSYNGIG